MCKVDGRKILHPACEYIRHEAIQKWIAGATVPQLSQEYGTYEVLHSVSTQLDINKLRSVIDQSAFIESTVMRKGTMMKQALLIASVLMASLSPIIAHTSYSADFNSIIQTVEGWWKCCYCGSENPDITAHCNGCAKSKYEWMR